MACWHIRSRTKSLLSRVLPDFIIFGAQKCGTSFLYGHLSQHPHVLPASRKEVHFFDRNYSRGVSWYRAQFARALKKRVREYRCSCKQVTGEASPYYIFYPHAPRRIRELLPNIRLVVLLRDPVERAYSHYHHEVRKGREDLSFAEAIEKEPERLAGEVQEMMHDEHYSSSSHRFYSYVSRGIYVDQLTHWFKYFDPAQVLILNSKDSLSHPAKTLDHVCKFLGIAAFNAGTSRIRKQRSRYASMDKKVRRHLVDVFRPHNQRLYELLGVDFGWQT